MLRRLYDRVLLLSADRRAPVWLALVSFAESSFFPIPPDVLLFPMALAKPERAYRFAFLCTVASVLGGMLGYLIGYALYEQLAAPLIHFYHLENAAEAFVTGFQNYGFWIIIVKGLVPVIPYKLVTIASGLAHFDFATFVIASIITRAARFYLVAAAVVRYGAPVQAFVEQRLALITSLTAAGVIGVFLLARFI